jgi:hypothetical protein
MFLKSLLAQHVSDVTASIVRSTTVVFAVISFFLFLVCLFRVTCIGVGTHRHCITVSFKLKLTVIGSVGLTHNYHILTCCVGRYIHLNTTVTQLFGSHKYRNCLFR